MLQDLGLGWIVFVAVAALICMIFVFATPDAVSEARQQEHERLVDWVGEEKTAKAVKFANHYFEKHFIESGLVSQVKAMTIPTAENKAKATGLEDFLTGFFSHSEQRIEGLWGMVYGAYKRVAMMTLMAPYAATLVFAALVGGLVERRISIESKRVANAVYFHGAKRALYMLMLAPLFLLFWPWAISAVVWLAWFVLFPTAIWVASRNVQEL